MAIEQVGIKFVTQGAPQAAQQIAAVNKSYGQLASTIGKVDGKGIASIASQIQKAGSSASGSVGGLGNFSKMLEGLGSRLPAVQSALGAMPPQLLAVAGGATVAAGAIAGLAIAYTAFTKLGARGAVVDATAQAFGNIVSGFGDATTVLNGLRTATRGTVSDFELLRLTTLSLQGSTTSFRNVLLQTADDGTTALGRVFDATARVGQATGQSADIIREKFLLGLRRQSALLLDDVGVKVDAELANQRYAESLGLVASTLNDEQKQAAFAAEAIRQLDAVAAELGGIDKGVEGFTRFNVAIQNSVDRIAQAVQPAYSALGMVVGALGDAINQLSLAIAPVVFAFSEVASSIFNVVSAVLEATGVLGFLNFWFQMGKEAAVVFASVMLLVSDGLNVLAEGIRGASARIQETLGVTFENSATTIKDFIRDAALFLAEGGGFIISAFAAGIANGASSVISAVTFIAQIVADFLQGFSPPKRGPLSQIDKGGENVAAAWASGFVKGIMQPVQEAASFVEGRLGAIGKFTATQIEAAFARLDRGLQPFKEQLEIIKADFDAIAGFTEPALNILNKQIARLIKGGADASQVQAIDRQVDQLREIRSLQQDRVDQAELQLALAQAQQAQERALLNIQKNRLGVAKETGSAVAKASGLGAGAKAPSAGGGAAAEPSGGGGGAPLTKGDKATLFDKGEIEAFAGELQGAFARGIDRGGAEDAIAGLQGNLGELDTQIGRIRDSDPVTAISDKFAGLETAIVPVFDTIKTTIQGVLDTLFGETGTITTAFDSTFGEGSIFRTLFGSETEQGAIASAIEAVFSPATGAIAAGVVEIFGAGGVLGAGGIVDTSLQTVQTWFDSTFGAGVNSISSKVTSALTSVAESLTYFFESDGAGSLSSILSTLGDTLDNSLIYPLRDGVEAMVNTVIGGINGVISAINRAIDIASSNGFPTPERIDSIPEFKLPAFADGVRNFKGGLALVGERGPELVRLPSGADVIPNNMLSTPAAMPAMAGFGDTYNNTTNTSNMNINVNSVAEAALLQRQMLAFQGI